MLTIFFLIMLNLDILTKFLNFFFSIGFLAAFTATLAVVGYNDLGEFPEILCKDESICLFDKSGAYAIVQAGLALLSLFLFTLKFCIDKTYYSMHGWVHVFLSVGAAVFFFMRLINVGYFDWAWKDQGCKDPSVTGSPFERLARYGSEIQRDIKTISECSFNAFNQENILYSSSQVSYKIDWSNKDTYTEAQRQSLLTNANGVLSDPYNIDNLPYFYDAYYWGCNNICLPLRYDMNVAWVWMSLAACLSEVALAVLSFWVSYIFNEKEDGTPDEQEQLIEVEAVPVDQTGSDDSKDSSSSEPVEVPSEFLLKL